VGLRWTLRDISARVRAEEEVRLLNAQLEERVQNAPRSCARLTSTRRNTCSSSRTTCANR